MTSTTKTKYYAGMDRAQVEERLAADAAEAARHGWRPVDQRWEGQQLVVTFAHEPTIQVAERSAAPVTEPRVVATAQDVPRDERVQDERGSLSTEPRLTSADNPRVETSRTKSTIATLVAGLAGGILVLGAIAAVSGTTGIGTTPAATAVPTPRATPTATYIDTDSGVTITGDDATFMAFLAHTMDATGDDAPFMTAVHRWADYTPDHDVTAKRAHKVEAIARSEVDWLDEHPPADCYADAWSIAHDVWETYTEAYGMLGDAFADMDFALMDEGKELALGVDADDLGDALDAATCTPN